MDGFEFITPHFLYVVNRHCAPSWHIGPFPHPAWNLTLVYDGHAHYESAGLTRHVTAGDLVCTRPGECRHAYTFEDAPMKCFAVDFACTSPEWAETGWRLVDRPLPLETFDRITDPMLFDRLISLFDRLAKIWLSGTPHAQSQCRAVFIEFLNLLLDRSSPSEATFDQRRKVARVIAHMTDHYMEKLSLADLAEVVGVSVSHLGNLFRAVTGHPPIETLLEIRMNKARQLLEEGISVTETAALCGFRDVYYFSRAFRKANGMPPTRLHLGRGDGAG